MTLSTAGLLTIALLLSQSAWAGQTDVLLFGQKCRMQGPVDNAVLDRIHAIGPEQVAGPTTFKDAPSKTRASLDKVRKASGLPAALDRYKERLGRRLEAQVRFLEAYEAARSARKSSPLIELSKKAFKGKSAQEFDAIAGKLEAKKFASPELSTQLFDFYNERIEPDPAEDFHRSIRALGIKYDCSYDESPGEEEDDAEENAPAAAPPTKDAAPAKAAPVAAPGSSKKKP